MSYLKKFIWNNVHKFRINKNVCLIKNPWGWISQKEILKLKKYKIPESIECDTYINKKRIFYEVHLINYIKKIYLSMFKSYFMKKDFTEKLYTTPKLSLALNYFNELIIEKNLYIKKPDFDLNDIQIEVIGSWLSNEITTSNDKFLGMWDFEQVKHELIAGALGPEITYTWDQMPIKQNVLLQVKINNHIDIVKIERCLSSNDDKWKINNINNIIS